MTPSDIHRLTLRIFTQYQLRSTVAILPMAYLVSLAMGLERQEALTTAKYLLPLLIVPVGVAWPYLTIRHALRGAADLSASPSQRLYHLLRAPRLIEANIVISSVLGTLLYVGLPSVYYKKNLWAIPWAGLLMALLMLIMWIDLRLSIEGTLRPHVITELRQLRNFELSGSGLLWPRHRWYLPYTFGLYVVCTVAVLLTIIIRGAQDTIAKTLATARAGAELSLEQGLYSFLDGLASQVQLPLALLGTYLVVTAAMSAWRLANHLSEGARSVQEAIEALASGSPRMPDWASTDELGDLSLSTAKVFVHLKQFSLSIGDSARSLMQSAQELVQSTTEQNEVIARQAAALQETQVTAQEIKQTSAMASQKAEAILRQTEKVDSIGQTAEVAIERSIRSLQEIRDSVKQMAQNIQQLNDKTQQIANITGTVKDLADQSNMLALNAAIEAVRSGEQGKGFGVVAREIRSLADQSILATQNVREVLQDITTAISTTVHATERGVSRIEEGVEQVREFGESVRQLSNIVRESGASVRQIYAAVAQQNTGVNEIFKAISELSKAMDQTLERLKASDQALSLVQSVTGQVGTFVKSYGWQDLQAGPAAPKQASP